MTKKKGSTRLNPCHGCPVKKGCSEHPQWVAKISGLGLRSVTFDCARLAGELKVGRRISITGYFLDGPPDEHEIRRRLVKATITNVDGRGRFSAVVDAGQLDEPGEDDKFRFRKTMGAYRILGFLDEPRAKVCDAGAVTLAGADKCQCRPSMLNEKGECSCLRLVQYRTANPDYPF